MSKKRSVTTERITLGELQNPVTCKGLDLWQHSSCGRAFPARGALPPAGMSEILGNTVLVKVLEGGREFEIRIVGDAIVVAQGSSFKGMTLHEIDEVLPGYGSLLREVYRYIYNHREAVAFRGWFERRTDNRAFFHETLMLPLGDGEAEVDHIMVVGVHAFDHADNLR